MILNKNKSIISLFSIVLILCVACGGRNSTTDGDTQSGRETDAVAARLTAVAEADETDLQPTNVEPTSEQLADPVAAPTSTTSTQRLSVDIVRSDSSPVSSTAIPATQIPPTAIYTAVPHILAKPTNTPVLLTTEPFAIQPSLQTPETEPIDLPGNAPAVVDSVAQSSNLANFAGRWLTNVGVIDLEQVNDRVTGSYQLYGDSARFALNGLVSGRTLSGDYTGFDGGTFKFELEPDEISFDGSWFYQGAGSANHWCGVRDGPLKPWCGFSGPWESIGDYVADTPPVTEVVQIGDRIEGTFVNGIYAEEGVIEGQVGLEGVGSQLIAIGRWSIAGSSGEFRWALQDQKSDQSIGYSVTSDGVLHQWCNWRPGLSMPAECFEPK